MVQVTVGEEGFFGPGSPDDAANPQVTVPVVVLKSQCCAATISEAITAL